MASSLAELWRRWLPSTGEAVALHNGVGPIVKSVERTLAPPGLKLTVNGESQAARHGRGVFAIIEGNLIKEGQGRAVGFVRRVIDTHLGEARHDEFHLVPGLQGQGLARKALATTVELYGHLGIATAFVNASEVGRYVWAAAGFDFENAQARGEVLASVRPMAQLLGYELPEHEISHAWELARLRPDIRVSDALAADNPEMTQFSELRGLDPHSAIRLGKALMLSGGCDPWVGELKLGTQNPGYIRFQSYIAN